MSKLYVKKSNIIGDGLYCKDTILKGDTAGYIHGPVCIIRTYTKELKKKTVDWIGVGRYSWIDTTNSPFSFINHSCEPNVIVVSKRRVIALENILPDTELTMDYSLTEADIDWRMVPSKCQCKAKSCRKEVTSIGHLSKATFAKYKKYIPKNFQKIYARDSKKNTL